MQDKPVAKVIVYLFHTGNGDIKGTVDTEIILGIEHFFQFVHCIVDNEFPVVFCLKQVDPPVAIEVGNILYIYAYKFFVDSGDIDPQSGDVDPTPFQDAFRAIAMAWCLDKVI